MKSFALSYLFTITLFMTGCQSIQFVDSPIPVKNAPIKNTLPKTAPTTPIAVQSQIKE